MATERTPDVTEPTLEATDGKVLWTSAEDVILILGREESAVPLTFAEISRGLSRKGPACAARYHRLCWHGLEVPPHVLETLSQLWIQ